MIRQLNLPNLKVDQNIANMTHYVSENMFMTEITDQPNWKEAIHFQDIASVGYCMQGEVTISIDDRIYTISKNDLVFCKSNSFIRIISMSPDFRGKLIGIQEKLAINIFLSCYEITDVAYSLYKNPVLHITEEEAAIFNKYYDLQTLFAEQKPHRFSQECHEAFVKTCAYELLGIISQHIDNVLQKKDFSQGDILFRKFIDLLKEYEGKERSVRFYSDRLCVTPKYLSVVCKKASGRTALSWIHEFMVSTIKQQLAFSQKSIKEISGELDFPNISFFGKFFKQQTGMSPREYRRSLFK